jgi:hypothetical protein
VRHDVGRAFGVCVGRGALEDGADARGEEREEVGKALGGVERARLVGEGGAGRGGELGRALAGFLLRGAGGRVDGQGRRRGGDRGGRAGARRGAASGAAPI